MVPAADSSSPLAVFRNSIHGSSSPPTSPIARSAVFAVVLLVKEKPPKSLPPGEEAAGSDGQDDRGLSLQGSKAAIIDVARNLRDAMLQPSIRPLLFLLATYKLGETLSDSMFKPFLLDRGVSSGEIARLSGQGSMLASIFGSLLGGEYAWGWGGRGKGEKVVTLAVIFYLNTFTSRNN